MLDNLTILILSPQAWGKMFLSKHHYAIELARRGNRVYFLNPPGEGGTPSSGSIEIVASGITPGLHFVSHKLWFPYNLKFHALPLFHVLMKGHVRKILQRIEQPVDIVWSFDLGNLYPFSFFGRRPLKIFHPVDEPLNRTAINSGLGADVLFSVTREILDKYQEYAIPRHFINHGVSAEFLASAADPGQAGGSIRFGFSGNLLRPDIDRDIFLHVVRENPAVSFECWGSYSRDQSNIGGDSDDAGTAFVAALQALPNVILHGPVPSFQLAKEIHRMDGFLICYDIAKDQSSGTNYHKIMEYLSTGKVIVSNNVSTYRDRPDLIRMVAEREDNRRFPALFRQVTADLDRLNAPDAQALRRAFAADNTYEKQVARIASLLPPSGRNSN